MIWIKMFQDIVLSRYTLLHSDYDVLCIEAYDYLLCCCVIAVVICQHVWDTINNVAPNYFSSWNDKFYSEAKWHGTSLKYELLSWLIITLLRPLRPLKIQTFFDVKHLNSVWVADGAIFHGDWVTVRFYPPLFKFWALKKIFPPYT
jgi:hypothetical protein